jgi:tRNA G18 (ribose-2'-O)-methylase SpoU
VVLRVLLTRSRFAVESVLLAESQLGRLGDLLAQAPTRAPVYSASRAVMDAIVGFPIHRGILAIGQRGPAPSPADLLTVLPVTAFAVGLVGLANHDNVGGIFRNAAAFGADAVLLDRESCDPLYRKAIRVSVGGALIVPFARAESPDALCDALEGAGFEIVALSPSGREPLSQVRRTSRTALLLGAEGPGLPDRILARCRTVSIPMVGSFDSLNVATTSGIALHHLAGA